MSSRQCLECQLATVIGARCQRCSTRRRMRGRKLIARRQRIALRDGAQCRRCGRTYGRLELDHIVALKDGGADADRNCQLLCGSCHKAKTRTDAVRRRAHA